MKNFEHIYTGCTFCDEELNEHLITGYNGHIVYTTVYAWWDEDESGEPYELDEPRISGEATFTLSEIGDTMKFFDGENHKVTWDAERAALCERAVEAAREDMENLSVSDFELWHETVSASDEDLLAYLEEVE